ncbi:hypothetical protein IE81DRAFT_127755 [Ceraceosorus guamensis]|uniref:Uncharacterized protein n=1 Tax=Ceraceosorus guamensis TaxID=1522189 RepID=A0A316W7J4_9BASI|nr:hypothetical protein IE81DRAFT_127755 [Ceraceosorus guamensis]PWN45839.1 hypothetical protein IE81DRAFT_127755 [Ceraceosorus guamensis]
MVRSTAALPYSHMFLCASRLPTPARTARSPFRSNQSYNLCSMHGSRVTPGPRARTNLNPGSSSGLQYNQRPHCAYTGYTSIGKILDGTFACDVDP